MAKTGFSFVKLLLWGAGAGLAFVVAAGVAIKILLPPEKIQKLVVEKASESLHREVRLRGVSVGLRGLTLEGLEVSEKPDFAAGKFLGVEGFTLRVELMPLLHKKVVIDEISVEGPIIVVKKDKKGKFNFDDLAAAPPQSKKVQKKAEPAGAAPPIAFELKVGKASLSDGLIEYSDAGTGMNVKLSGIDAVAKDLALDQSTGKVSATLSKLAAEVSGLKLDVSGELALDPKKVEVSGFHGRFDQGDLKLAMTARDYLSAPDVQLDASLSELDLDRLLAVKQATMGSGTPSEAAGKGTKAAPAPAPVAASNAPPLKTKGKAVLGKMTYGNAKVNETTLTWDLSGITPDMRRVAGTAHLHIAGGTIASSGSQPQRNGIVKALMFPVTIVQSIGKVLGPILPGLNNLLFTEVVGDYSFDRGVMTIKDFHMDSAVAEVRTSGTADLGAQRLNLIASIGPVVVDVTGTFDKPSIKPRLSALLNPGKDVIKQATSILKGFNIFKK